MDVMNSCCCCLRCAPDRDLTTPHTHLGKTETFSDLLKECFNIHLVLDGSGPCGICSACVGRLRDASDFKLQVQRSQAELQALLVKTEIVVKSEQADDGVEEETVFKLFYEEPIENSEVGQEDTKQFIDPLVKSEMDDVMSDGDYSAADSTPAFASAPAPSTSQLALACRVRLERLRGHDGRTSTHNEEKPYACDDCGKNFTNKAFLSKHIQHTHLLSELSKLDNVSGKNVFKCSECNYKCAVESSLRDHQTTHTSEKPYACSYCDYRCRRKKYLWSHMKIHSSEKPYACSYCDYRCRVKKRLQDHVMIHTGEKPYACNSCEYKTSQKSHLKRHQLTHTGEMPYACRYCDLRCKDKSYLRTHEMKHTEKPYACSYCDYKCIRKVHLVDHESVHTGEIREVLHAGKKSYECNSCDYKCSQKRNFQRHMRKMHAGEKPFECSACDFQCRKKSNLRRHMLLHTNSGDKPYKCDHCNYATRYKNNLPKHLSKHAGGFH